MGWPKYMEDNMEITQERLLEYNPYQCAHPITHQAANTGFRTQTVTSELSTEDVTILMDALEGLFDSLPLMQEAAYKDKKIICKSCGCTFLFPASRQKIFAERGWNQPKRCKRCRDSRTAAYCMRPSF